MRRLNQSAICVAVVVSFAALSRCGNDHYEPQLRAEFQVPSSAQFTVMQDEFGDGFKENLKYNAQFTLSDRDFQAYQTQVEQDPHWQCLPMAKDALAKITKRDRIHDYILQTYYPAAQPPTAAPITFTPQEAQYFQERLQYLNLNLKEGAYQCLTAGTDLMYTRKVSCTQRPGRLNDLMLAVLDYQTKTLKIRAYTGY